MQQFNMFNNACAATILDRDTLGEIFSACVKLDEYELEGSNSSLTRMSTTLNTCRAPWVLGQVCQSWRRIVLSSPLLWTSVNIRLDEQDRYAAHHASFLLDLYLSRSAYCRLSVSIHSSTGFQTSPPFLRSLLSTSSRWHTLMINIPISSYEALSTLTGFLDALKVLHLRLPHRNKSLAVRDFASMRDGVRLFRFCSNLERLSLQNIPFPRDIFHLPWAKIRRLNVYSSSSLVSNAASLRALHGLRNLTSCSIECRFVNNRPNLQRLTLPFVESLTLLSAGHHYDTEMADDGGKEITQMLSWLTLPALRHLQLRQLKAKIESEDSLVIEVIQLIRRSRCEIRELQLLFYPPISEAGITSIVKEVASSLQKLCLHPGYRGFHDH
ncbi:hypothetical protein J3R30DRAFT_3706006 [Lentinula aciculospora]|uniref:F-box domain-containing protein n=1 Tax=Lentinula aciculospora TaxID=153920 RepID=A0A9W9DL33_9AGAR|nr:hypothetical protein J3R30DRAFT_3706006 [Lentinula aciculospora]